MAQWRHQARFEDGAGAQPPPQLVQGDDAGQGPCSSPVIALKLPFAVLISLERVSVVLSERAGGPDKAAGRLGDPTLVTRRS